MQCSRQFLLGFSVSPLIGHPGPDVQFLSEQLRDGVQAYTTSGKLLPGSINLQTAAPGLSAVRKACEASRDLHVLYEQLTSCWSHHACRFNPLCSVHREPPVPKADVWLGIACNGVAASTSFATR